MGIVQGWNISSIAGVVLVSCRVVTVIVPYDGMYGTTAVLWITYIAARMGPLTGWLLVTVIVSVVR
jgi:hypothetical protein